MKPVSFECSLDVLKAYEDDGRWIVEGFAATSDFDLQEDIITQKAIESSAKDLIENSTVLHNHNTNEAIGKVELSEAKKGGLWLKILVSKTAGDIWQKIKEGVLNKFSIRGKILDAKKKWIPDVGKYARVISKMRLIEVSLVAVPANPKARAIRWYVEKALDEYESKGGELDIEVDKNNEHQIDEGGIEMNEDTEIIEEEDVSEEIEKELYEASGDIELNKADGEEPDDTDEEEDEDGNPKKKKKGRMSKLKKLLEELQEILNDTEPDDPEDEDNEGVAKSNGFMKKLEALDETMKKITKALGFAEDFKKGEGGEDDNDPTLTDVLKNLSNRLAAIEGVPAIKSSVEGQEKLAGDDGKNSVWKGLV